MSAPNLNAIYSFATPIQKNVIEHIIILTNGNLYQATHKWVATIGFRNQSGKSFVY